MPKMKTAASLPLFLLFALFLSAAHTARCQRFTKTPDGIIVYPGTGTTKAVRLNVVSDKIIHVSASPATTFTSAQSLMALPYKSITGWKTRQQGKDVYLETAALHAIVSTTTGQVRFTDKKGNTILAEAAENRSFAPVTVDGSQLYKVCQAFQSPQNEAFYGLGQHQEGIMNYRGENVTLLQQNSDVAIPFMVSTRNYGILWDNYSITQFGDCRSYEPLSTLRLFDKNGTEGSLSASYMQKKSGEPFIVRGEDAINYPYLNQMNLVPAGYKMGDGDIIWEGDIASGFSGEHKFLLYSGGYVKLWVDGKEIADIWRQSWNPASTRFNVQMKAGEKHHVKLAWTPDGGESYCSLKWLSPIPEKDKEKFAFYSEAGQQADYYFVAGTNMDDVISGYRQITGKAVLMPKWAMGFWQSRERYKTQDEILTTVAEFRKRNIGLDNIVLDWSYWKEDQWGSHEFEQSRFPDAAGMIKELHDKYHTQLMISVWPKFYVNTEHFRQFDKQGWMYKDNIEKGRRDWIGKGYLSSFYDAYNPGARNLFWNQINDKLYSKGIDAWWLDATEPDIHSNLSIEDRKDFMNPTALGSSTAYFNAYALQNAKGVYEGQRRTNANNRVFILTRSAFGGLQRYAAATWSGDIGARWRDMKNQIAAGVNFSMSGLPYWTQDIGGFSVEKRYEKAKGADLDEWREQMTRWYQFGAFCPIFRVHGQFPFREIYNVAPEDHPAYTSMAYYNRLRYRLMPYIYSLAGMAYQKDYTIMRGMVMDFPEDEQVRNINDQFMFGNAFLVNPVTDYKATSRSVYLPAGTGWYNAYNGAYMAGGKTIQAAAAYDTIPLFIKEGSIIPTGPALQYTTEKPADTLTVFVYTGKDGRFSLYEDEGSNYNYEKGKCSNIDFTYNETAGTLTIGNRSGSFNGMLNTRTIRIVFIDSKHPQPLDAATMPQATLTYTGKLIQIHKPKD